MGNRNEVKPGRDSSPAGEIKLVAGILATAWLVRLIHLLQSSAGPAFLFPLVDAGTYHELARQLATDGTVAEKIFWQPIWYPLYLAGVHALFGTSIVAVKILQALLGGLTCWLTYRLGRACGDRATGIIAAGIVAFYGPLVFFETELLAAGWAAFWSVLLVLLFVRAGRYDSGRLAFAVGAGAALGVVIRPTFLPFGVAGGLWLAWRWYRPDRRWRHLLARFGSLAAGALLVVVPAGLFSLRVTGHVDLLPVSGGMNLFIGNNPRFTETVTARPGWEWTQLRVIPAQHGRQGDVWQRRQFYLEQVRNYIRERPAEFSRGLLQKTLHLLSSREIPRNVDIYLFCEWSWLLHLLVWKGGGFGFPFGVLLPLAVLGLVLRWRRVPVPLKLYVLLYGAAIVLVFVTARYRVAMVPVLAVLAAGGGLDLWRRWRRRRWRGLAPAVPLLVATLLLATLPGPFAQERKDLEPEIYHGVGYCELEAGNHEAAVGHLRHALLLRADFIEAHHHLGIALARLGRYAEAEAHFSAALAIDPAFSDARENLKRLAKYRQ